MNRSVYFGYCEKKLNFLCFRIKQSGKLNLLELHIHSEDFFSSLLNLMYGFSFINANSIQQNSEGIDLIDQKNQLFCQVSGTKTKKKVEKSLAKDYSGFKDYRFKFVALVDDADNLRKATYQNPSSIKFNPSVDVYCCKALLNTLLHANITQQKEIYELIKKELSEEVEERLEETNIAGIINILAKEDLDPIVSNDAEIYNLDDKVKLNKLELAEQIIESYMLYHSKIAEVYAMFDKYGKNKSVSVLHFITKCYIRLKKEYSGDDLFFKIIDDLISIVKKSSNYEDIPFEELEMCVSIIVVDSFIRCHIFEKPKQKD